MQCAGDPSGLWSTESCTCSLYAMNSTFVFPPIRNNYKSKGFNQGPAAWSSVSVCFFMFVCADEGLASKWIWISQRSSNGNIWSLSSQLIWHTPGHTTAIPAHACMLREAHGRAQTQGLMCKEECRQCVEIRATPSVSPLHIAWLRERHRVVNGLVQCAIVCQNNKSVTVNPSVCQTQPLWHYWSAFDETSRQHLFNCMSHRRS